MADTDYASQQQDPSFSPPVYQQRYRKVLDVVQQYLPKKVVDFGCAECRFIRLLRNEIVVENIIGVDIDQSVLERHVESIRPLATDYLQPRITPLALQLFWGSLSEYDERLDGVDMVIMIEVIEHLIPSVLQQFPENIFKNLNPRVIVITTPNADFNVLFKTLNHDEFRHWDHKFEWTRDQFQDWCQNMSVKYGYSVAFSGIGEGPAGTEKYGCCSQMCVFVKKVGSQSRTKISDLQENRPYHLIEQCIFPHINDTKNKKVLMNNLLQNLFTSGTNGYSWKNMYTDCNSQFWSRYRYDFNSVALRHKRTSNNVALVSGQFQDAERDNSAFTKQRSVFVPSVPIRRDKFGRTGFIKYLQKKYFTGRNFMVLPGQFADGLLDTSKIHKPLNFSHIIDSKLYMPLIVVVNFMVTHKLEVTSEEIVKFINENEKYSATVSKNGFVLVDLLGATEDKDISEKSSDDEKSDIDLESKDTPEHVWYSMEDFLQENWEK